MNKEQITNKIRTKIAEKILSLEFKELYEVNELLKKYY